jgi:cell wall-associated NlpC family hydrolase
LAERYNAAKGQIQTLDASLRTLAGEIQVKRAQLGQTSHALVESTVRAYVLGAADAQWLDLFRQDILKADARNTYETQVIGNLHDLRIQITQQQQSLNASLLQERSQRAAKAREAANMQSLLAQNARNEATTRATLSSLSRKLKKQIIAYETSVAIAASKRHDTATVNKAIAAAAAVGGQAAVLAIQRALKPVVAVHRSGATSAAGLKALQYAMSVRGLPYVWGGESPRYGFDCSGLTQWSWIKAGYYIPRTAAEQWYALRHVPLNALQPGDLLFYYNLDNDHQVDHVVMYAGSGPWGDKTIISAAHTGTVISLSPIFTYGLIGAGRP